MHGLFRLGRGGGGYGGVGRGLAEKRRKAGTQREQRGKQRHGEEGNGEENSKWQIANGKQEGRRSGRLVQDGEAGVCFGHPELSGFCLGMSKALTFCALLRAGAWRVIGCGLAGGEKGAEWGQGAHGRAKVIIFGGTIEHLQMGCFLLGFWARCAR